MPHAPPCPFLACLEPPDLVSPWQAARPQRKGTSPADDCAPPRAGLLLGGGACAQAAVRGHLGLGRGGPSPHLIPTLTSPFKPGLLPHLPLDGLKPAPLTPQAQRQLLHAELKLVLQQTGERKPEEPGAQGTPSSAMEARSRSAEVSTLQRGPVGPWWGALSRVALRHFLASLPQSSHL